jgi:hypothetical protein
MLLVVLERWGLLGKGFIWVNLWGGERGEDVASLVESCLAFEKSEIKD